MPMHKGHIRQFPVRFVSTDDGLFTIWDHGGTEGDVGRPFAFAGTIQIMVTGGRRRWAVRASNGRVRHMASTWNAARAWYLAERGLAHALPPPPPEMKRCAVHPRTWERADEWKAAVWNALSQRYRAPIVNRLLTPVDVQDGYLIFAWPQELIDYWIAQEPEYV